MKRAKGNHPFWVDKWHISPYYSTAHAIIACAGFENALVEKSVDWIIKSQNANGSWGAYIPTAEETAYAVQALWIWNEKVSKVPKAIFNNANRWLKEHTNQPYPPLWIAKCLFSPHIIIRSAIISALTMTQ
ncbi:MAG: hypothetical protein MZV64_19375 [Ignavibacteriales bacterium]|nr:hypothetical protein [Ignavibacteriales bacterium]